MYVMLFPLSHINCLISTESELRAGSDVFHNGWFHPDLETDAREIVGADRDHSCVRLYYAFID